MVCYWCVERQGRRQYLVYSSHVIGRACPDILIRITVGSRISLRSLYPKAFENLNYDLLKVSLLWIINYNIVLEAFVPLDCHSPSVFLLRCLGCCILLLNVFFNLKCLSLYIVFKLDYVFIVV